MTSTSPGEGHLDDGVAMRPSGWTKWSYYLLRTTPPERYRAFVEADINSRGFVWRDLLTFWLTVVVVTPLYRVVAGKWPGWPAFIGILIGSAIGIAMRRNTLRASMLRFHNRKWDRRRLKNADRL